MNFSGIQSRLTASGGLDLPCISKTLKYPVGTRIGELEVKELQISETIISQPMPILPPKPTVSRLQSSVNVTNMLNGADYYPNCWYTLDVHQGLDPQTFEPTIFAVVRIYPVRVNETSVKYLSSVKLGLQIDIAENSVSRSDGGLFVIAPQFFLNEMNEFIAHKQSVGLATHTRSLEDIDANENGRDTPERVKRSIERAYNEWSIRYVILAGDADQIPVRYTFHSDCYSMSYFQNTPSDLYYADLFDRNGSFCTWDANGNDLFGEYDNGNIDQCDLLPDILIGRLPASTTDELSAILNKIIHYETSIAGTEDWLNRIVLAGANIWNEALGDTSGIPEGEYIKEVIADESLSGYDLIKLYQTDAYEHTAELNCNNLASAINNGAMYVNFANHGNVECWSTGDRFSVTDVDALTNYDQLPVIFTLACESALFDTENPECYQYGIDQCMGEAFLLNPCGGAISYFGSTRPAFAGGHGFGVITGSIAFLDREFFKAQSEGHSVLGRLYSAALSAMILDHGLAEGSDFITVFQFIHFGDPSLCAGTNPSTPDFQLLLRGIEDSPDGNGCAEPGETIELLYELFNDGSEAQEVTATLAVDDPGITIINGVVNLPDLPRGGYVEIAPAFSLVIDSSSVDNRPVQLNITISHNDGSITFDRKLWIGEIPCLEANFIWISTGNINWDRTAGPGEQIKFSPSLSNIGCVTASGLTGEIEIDDPWVRLYRTLNECEIPDIFPGETILPVDLFWAEIDPGTPDGHKINCHITMRMAPENLSWEFDLPIQVFDFTYPGVDRFSVSPADPGPGDTVTITARVRDTSGVESVTGTFRSFDTGTSQNFIMNDDGNHNDGLAGDDIFGVQINLPDASGYFLVDLHVCDNLGFEGTISNAGGLTTVPFESNHSVLVVSRSFKDLYLGHYTCALKNAGYNCDIWSWYRGIPPEAILDQYTETAIIWFYAGSSPVLEKQERDAIDNYLLKGGKLLMTEQDIGLRLVKCGTPQAAQWYENTLFAEFVSDSAIQKTIDGVTGDPVGDGLEFSILGGSSAKNQDFPSLINPIPPAQACFKYKTYPGPDTGTAGLHVEVNGAKLVYLAFGFEGISSQIQRRDVMSSIMNWFDVPKEEGSLFWTQSPGWWTGPGIPDSIMLGSAFCEPVRRIYLSGGLNNITNIPETPFDPFEEIGSIDPAIYYIDTETSESGDTGINLSTGRFLHSAVYLEDHEGPKIYFISGLDEHGELIRDIEVYDPLKGEINVISTDPLPDEIDGPPGSWAVTGNKAYLIGVLLFQEPYQRGSTWIFDPNAPEGQKWHPGADLIKPRVSAGTAVLDGKIYLIGGIKTKNGFSYNFFNDVEMLDTMATNPQWDNNTIENLPKSLYCISGVGIPAGANVPPAGSIIVTGNKTFTSSAEYIAGYIYDVYSNTWRDYWPSSLIKISQPGIFLVPSSRGPEVWSLGGYLQAYNCIAGMGLKKCYGYAEIYHLGDDPRGSWIGIHTNQDRIPGKCTLRIGMELAGDRESSPIDCYIALEIFGQYYFITADPYFPNFTDEPLPFFTNIPLPEDFAYSGPLLEIPLPDEFSTLFVTAYAVTVYSGTSDLAGGLTWIDFTVGE